MDLETAFTFDRERLNALARKHGPGFPQGEPFAHVVIDDFVPRQVVRDVITEFPGPGEIRWQEHLNAREKKLASADESVCGPFTRHLIHEFNSARFVGFLELLSGIDGLVPDPWLEGGGLHQIQRGGYLKIHADFNKQQRLNLDRRLNAILYLNEDWDESYGGALELWSSDMSRCVQSVLPLAGRLIVFVTTSKGFHGHPDPLACPPGMTRRSLAFYYYTNGRPEAERQGPHWALFQHRPGDSKPEMSLKDRLRRWVPPAIVDGIRNYRDKRDQRQLR